MFRQKTKVTLSQNLQLGIAGPASQGTFLKVSGVFFLVLSLLLILNVFRSISKSKKEAAANSSIEAQVLGAFDKRADTGTENGTFNKTPETYTVQKGDTLFNIAQKIGINWAVIATLNNLKAPYQLKLGTVLKLR